MLIVDVVGAQPGDVGDEPQEMMSLISRLLHICPRHLLVCCKKYKKYMNRYFIPVFPPS